jgi:hypothetical protein
MIRLVVLIGIFCAFAAPAHASEPACPCWGGVEGLTPIVATADRVEFCETHPQVNTGGLAPDIGAEFRGFGRPRFPGHRVLISADAMSRPPQNGQCILFDDRDNTFVFIFHLTTQEAWSCIQDITAVCRGQGF